MAKEPKKLRQLYAVVGFVGYAMMVATHEGTSLRGDPWGGIYDIPVSEGLGTRSAKPRECSDARTWADHVMVVMYLLGYTTVGLRQRRNGCIA